LLKYIIIIINDITPACFAVLLVHRSEPKRIYFKQQTNSERRLSERPYYYEDKITTKWAACWEYAGAGGLLGSD